MIGPIENKFRQFYKILTIISSVSAIVLLILFYWDVHISRDWQKYQQEYKEEIIARTSGKESQIAAERLSVEIHQIIIDDINLVDRCTSCHTGISDLKNPANKLPLQSHSGSYLNDHFPTEYGCTICHGGRGRALDKDLAHSQEYEPPFLPLDGMQSNCGKCHLSVFQVGSNLKGTEKLESGKSIFQQNGCLGCHKIRATGGAIGPDLTSQGNKPVDAYYFENIVGEKSIDNWLLQHFIDPESVSPGSKMPAFKFSSDSLEMLKIFTRGLFRPELPLKYYSKEMLAEFKQDRPVLTGLEAYQLFCTACHTKNGTGRDYKKEKFGVPGLNNEDFLSMASMEMIEFTIREGRGTQLMGSWSTIHSGIHSKEITNILGYIREWKKKPPPYSEVRKSAGQYDRGKIIFEKNCAFCHGDKGEGGIGPGLNRQSLLANASDVFLFNTIIRGRANTAMPGWSRFDPVQLSDLLIYIRDWQKLPLHVSSVNYSSGNPIKGDSLFHYSCSRCHGATGSGGIGPAILYPDFLKEASDEFLKATIEGGRDHSAMFGLSQTGSTNDKSGNTNITDIITYMKTWRDSSRQYIESGADLGDPAYGKILFRQYCSECHGENGEGLIAPAINNQEFLNAASNGYLLGTISLGRSGTPMPSWGRGTETLPKLNTRDRRDIVSYIRNWQKVSIPINTRYNQ